MHTARRPNIVLIMSDQHNARTMGCAGEPLLRTPHLDRLAGEGVRFTNGFSNSAHCGPSRVSFLTGQYEHFHRRHRNTDEPPDHLNPLTAFLRARGYVNAFVGKGHLGVKWPRREFDYTRFGLLHDALPDDPLSCDYFRYLVEQGVADKFDLSKPFGRVLRPAIRSPQSVEHSIEAWTGREAEQFINAPHGDAPFFLMVSFERPHDPICAPAPCDTLYDPERVVLPKSAGDTFATKPAKQRRYVAEGGVYPLHPGDAYLRKCLANYYGLITLMDENIGRILAALEQKGILDDTIVIYTSDHGDFAGEHGFMYKNLGMYESIHRIPLLVRYPGLIGPGRTFDGIVESVDLYPTLCAMLGETPPASVQGSSWLSAMKEPETWTKRGALMDHVKGFYHTSLRTSRYRLTLDLHPGGEDELYDHDRDPDEMTNVWSDPGYGDIREHLSRELMTYRALPQLMQGTNPKGWRPDRAPGYEMPRHHLSIEALFRGVPWEDVKQGRYDAPPVTVSGQAPGD